MPATRWIILSLLIFLLCWIAGYTIRTGLHIWHFFRLDKQVMVDNVNWSIDPSDEDNVLIAADYHYTFEQKSYEGRSLWKTAYLNQWAAEEAAQRLSENPLEIWVDSAQPQFASLDKNFPLKESIYTFLLWILSVYFYCLNIYVRRQL